MAMRPQADPLLRVIERTPTTQWRGRVLDAFGTTIRVVGIQARIGQQCELIEPDTGVRVPAEVVGLADGVALLTPLAGLQGLSSRAEVVVSGDRLTVPVGRELLGRVIDARALPLDGGPSLPATLPRSDVFAEAPLPMSRRPIQAPFVTGVRAIDALLTVGVGQRVGVFSAAGVGKSTLLGMLARQSRADVNVIALIGERGREVREFLDDALGPEGLARSVVVVSTSDRSAMERVRAAYSATAIAEGFRAQGANVLLIMDSVTRFARALREIGLAVGEPAVRRGFPPSVFAELPRLFERAGNDAQGSITAFYSVLLEDEDLSDPVAEEVRSILDGHVMLSRKLAAAAQYPAIDVLGSVSRVFPRVASAPHRASAEQARALLARHAEIEFLLQVGEYKAGSDPLADKAIQRMPAIRALLSQPHDEHADFDATLAALAGVVG
jgi:type III secretion protein N (ATPase)